MVKQAQARQAGPMGDLHEPPFGGGGVLKEKEDIMKGQNDATAVRYHETC